MPEALDLSPPALLGTWDLDRTIDDRLAGVRSTVRGVTSLEPQPDGRVRWTESGTLRTHDREVPVTRVLFVEPREEGWFVTFEDGRDFHPWLPGTEVEHPCDPDLYVGTVAALDPDRWTVRWQVRGPRKDYTMSSVLSRRSR